MTTDPQANDRRARGLRLVVVLLGLTVVSGMIDAVSFLGLNHVFTANMTGNVLVLGFAAAGAVDFSVPHTVTSLVCFLAGAVTGGRIAVRCCDARRVWVRVTLAVEAVLVGASAVVAFAAPDAGGTLYAVIALTAFAMGVRNTTVVKLRVPDLTTTVLTRTLASLAADSRAGGGSGERTPRRAAAVLAMPAGAVLGAWLVIHFGLGPPLLVAAGVTGLLALVASERE
ncbi:membrane protein [Streptomyces sp. F-3]|uniref:YoaK family protein n=1 Tax=Streptomyces sp. F-3 TaxID=1840095 RepID=UPI0007C24F4B|nr:YoaK family protein [Streptomyces sp. F-3]GAT83562.1 membrane protein [Streptomyces sp. F-3]